MLVSTEVHVREVGLIANHVAGAAFTHGAVCVRGSGLDDAGFADFLAEIGTLVPTHNSRLTVEKSCSGSKSSTDLWQAALTYTARPPAFTALRAVEVPKAGGPTQIIDTRPLWDTLTPSVKAHLAGVRVLHSKTQQEPTAASEDVALHPLVRRQPETGRVGFFQAVPEQMVAAIDLEGNEALDEVHAIYKRISRLPAMTHMWQPGDLLFRDNRVTVERHEDSHMLGRRVLRRAMVRAETVVSIDPQDFALAIE